MIRIRTGSFLRVGGSSPVGARSEGDRGGLSRAGALRVLLQGPE